MGLNIFIGLVVIVVVLVTLWFKKKFSYWEKRGFEFIRPEFPFGNLKGVGFKFHFSEKTREYYIKYKNKSKAIGMYLFTAPVVLITDLDIVKHVLVKDFNNFHDRGFYVNTKADPLLGHLFGIDGLEWKNMRAKLTPTFTSGKIKMMFDIVLSICDEMIGHLTDSKDSKEIEMKDILARFTTDVIGNVAFGLEVNSMKNPDSMFRKMGRKVFKASQNFNFAITDRDVTEFFLTTIKETVEYRETNEIKRNDFLSLLIQIKNQGKLSDDAGDATDKLTLEQLAAQSFLFFIAGFETSSTTLSFALYELSLNPDVQEKLRDEIRSQMSKNENKLTYETMLEMKYLQMIIDETLRKHPPLDILVRIPKNDYKIPGSDLIVEKDTLTFIPVFGIHYNSEIYPEPEKFDPERFTEDNKKNRHSMAHLPFGEGPRNCIGLRFGLMQVKIGLIQLLMNFKFSPAAKTTIPMSYLPRAPLLCPVNDMWLTVEKL